MGKKGGKKVTTVQDKKKKGKDIVVRIDGITGRIPRSTRAGGVMQKGDKKKKERRNWKKDLKRYVEGNEESD